MRRTLRRIFLLFLGLTRCIPYYCTLCGSWCRPVIHNFNVEEKACNACLYKAKSEEK